MVNYRIEKSAPTPEGANDLLRTEAANVAKKLAHTGGLPDPSSLEYRVEFGGSVGKSEISFTDARERVKPSGDATYTVVAQYALSREQQKALQITPPRAGPHSNARENPLMGLYRSR